MPGFHNELPRGIEIHRCISEKGLTLTVRGALFISGRAELGPVNGVLERLVTVLRGYPDNDVTVEAHTDALGSDTYNHNLTQRRADCVKAYLVEHGVAHSRVTSLGKGASRPLAGNHTAAGRQLNSRVEVIVRDYIAHTL